MLSARLGIVFLITALFAATFASLVRTDGSKRIDAQCRVSTHPACFGPSFP